MTPSKAQLLAEAYAKEQELNFSVNDHACNDGDCDHMIMGDCRKELSKFAVDRCSEAYLAGFTACKELAAEIAETWFDCEPTKGTCEKIAEEIRALGGEGK